MFSWEIDPDSLDIKVKHAINIHVKIDTIYMAYHVLSFFHYKHKQGAKKNPKDGVLNIIF